MTHTAKFAHCFWSLSPVQDGILQICKAKGMTTWNQILDVSVQQGHSLTMKDITDIHNAI